MADGSHYENRTNCDISKTVGLISMKCGLLMHFGLLNPMGQKKIKR